MEFRLGNRSEKEIEHESIPGLECYAKQFKISLARELRKDFIQRSNGFGLAF